MKKNHYLSKRPDASRRKFLSHLSVGVGASVLASSSVLSSCSSGNSSKEQEKTGTGTSAEKKKLGLALVGLGNYSTTQLAPALQECQDCYLAGIVTGTPSKAEEWSKKYNIPEKNIYNYENYDELANNPDIDIIYVVLPNSMHAEYTIRAAKAGKHVITEKPMAISVQECEDMIAACKDNNVLLGVGYRLHYEPYTKEIKRLGQEQVFGRVTDINNAFGFTIGDPTQWRLKKDLAGGGALMDVGVYTIQAARYTSGLEPVSLTAEEFKTNPVKFSEVDETIKFQLNFPDGLVAQCETSYNKNIQFLKATAENGWFELSPAYDYGPLDGKTSEGPLEYPHIYEQALQMDDFARCVMNNQPYTTAPGEEGLQDMKIIEAIYASIANGSQEIQIA